MEPTTIRLSAELAEAADRIAERQRVTRSDVIRKALEEYCSKRGKGKPQGRLALLMDLVSYSGSGVGDLASRSEEHLRKRFRGRRRRAR